MCGINGAMAFEASPYAITEPYITRMRDTMTHRGPDGAGTWVSPDQRIGLGHRRLSIIDLSAAAAQPMCNQDQTLWLTYNGEIYNHAQLRAELKQAGHHQWKTDHSDTEVILHAYQQWGIDCVQKLRGMFAFALWDSKKQQLWLVRDRIGIKPLYYSIHNGRIVFASEIKALLQDPDQKRRIDEESLYHYLSFLTTPAPQTLFAGIHKLPNATRLCVHPDGRTETHRYWDVWDHTQPLTNTDDHEIAERLLAELRQAVQLRKISDVPVGVFLSGGIDSSTNAALFSQGETNPIKTFSIGYEGRYKSYQNELGYARTMANRAGAQHHEQQLTLDHLLDFLPEMVKLQDEPIADPVCVPVYYVSKLARDNGVTVCQVGEGADELFWGYPGWKTALRLQQCDDLPVPRSAKRLGLAALAAAGRSETLYYEWLRRGAAGQPVFWSGAEAFTETQKQRLLSDRLKAKFRHRTSWEAIAPIHQRFMDKAWETSHTNWMGYADLNLRLPELLLMRVDKMAMGVGLEGRVPFLDHKLVELAMSIPQRVKTRHGTLKHILKLAVQGTIPDELIHRKKQGFGVPVYEWFFDRLGPRAKQEIDAFVAQTDLLDSRYVQTLFDRGRGPQLWFLLNLAMWWKHHAQ